MKNPILKITIILLLTIFCINNKVSAKTSINTCDDEIITIIYIPGIFSSNYNETDRAVKKLHKHFANKRLGKYIISPEYKLIHWGWMPVDGAAYKLVSEGLITSNTTFNKSRTKKTLRANSGLVLNPYYKFFLFKDHGASPTSVYFRNYVQLHIFEVLWFTINLNNRARVYDIIDKTINELPTKYIFCGFSFGSEIAVTYVQDKIIKDFRAEKINPRYFDFTGLITTSDSANLYLSSNWDDEKDVENYKRHLRDFISYFIWNDKFWISLNHRNDLMSIGLADCLCNNNDKGKGFILYKINKATLLQKLAIFDLTNNTFIAHQWCFRRPKDFCNSVFKIYDEAMNGKK